VRAEARAWEHSHPDSELVDGEFDAGQILVDGAADHDGLFRFRSDRRRGALKHFVLQGFEHLNRRFFAAGFGSVLGCFVDRIVFHMFHFLSGRVTVCSQMAWL
jgi:hypothetical protein